MERLCKYAYKTKLKITTTDGEVFIGEGGDYDDGEGYDEPKEKSLTLYVKGMQPLGLYASEIKDIEVLEE